MNKRSEGAKKPTKTGPPARAAYSVDVRGRNINRDEAWYREADCAFLGWSWFTTDPGEYREAIAFTASVGGVAFMVNGEKELRGRKWLARRIAEAARRACDEFGVRLGLVSYSVPQTVRDFPWDVFADACDFGMPEIYDREGKYDPGYPRRAISRDQGPATGIVGGAPKGLSEGRVREGGDGVRGLPAAGWGQGLAVADGVGDSSPPGAVCGGAGGRDGDADGVDARRAGAAAGGAGVGWDRQACW